MLEGVSVGHSAGDHAQENAVPARLVIIEGRQHIAIAVTNDNKSAGDASRFAKSMRPRRTAV